MAEVLYHGTTYELVVKILAEGLDPKESPEGVISFSQGPRAAALFGPVVLKISPIPRYVRFGGDDWPHYISRQRIPPKNISIYKEFPDEASWKSWRSSIDYAGVEDF